MTESSAGQRGGDSGGWTIGDLDVVRKPVEAGDPLAMWTKLGRTPMLSHIELNVTDLEISTRFYLRALEPLHFRIADQGDGYVRLTNGKDAVLVLCPVATKHRERTHHHKGVGLSHFALTVDSPAALDAFAAHLAVQGIPLLGEGLDPCDVGDHRSPPAGTRRRDR